MKQSYIRILCLLFCLIMLFCACKDTPVPPDEPGSEVESEDVQSTPDESTTVQDPIMPDEVALGTVYPVPIETVAGQGSVSLATVTPDENAAKFSVHLQAAGLTVAAGGTPLSVTYRDLSADFSYGADEAYILIADADGVRIEAQTERGAFYAIVTLCDLLDGTSLACVTVKDAPRNPLRGVIEGFYGTAYTHGFRQELFAFMGENKMNAYIYAPKDDAKHRAQWRVKYSGAELETMRELIASANQNYVKFIYAISPGGDIDLGAGYDKDFAKLVAKCEQMYELGVRDFAIFLDDIPTLDAEGHAKLLNDFQTEFVATHEGVSDLVAITTEYCDGFLTSYTDKIAPLIHKDVELMWTGPGVVPATITNKQLSKIVKKYDRNVFIWWNYPVNDVLINNLYMGACEGLEETLYKSITGLVANPMNQGYASMVPLFTTADYLWNPEAYDKQASLAAACKSLAPDADKALLDFIGMTCASPMNNNTDSVELKGLLDAYKSDNNQETRAALAAYFAQMVQNADAITASANQNLYLDIAEWVAKYRAYGQMGLALMTMEQAYAEGGSTADVLAQIGIYKAAEKQIASNQRLVSTSVLTPNWNTLGSRINQLAGLADTLSFAPATPITDCNQYEDYQPSYMTDGDDATYFWTHGTLSQASGNGVGYFGVDLGEVITVRNVYIATGVGGSDVLQVGAVEYSTDKKSWTLLYEGALGDETLLKDLNFEARYVRVKQTDKTATNWVKVRAFEINTTRTVAADVQGEAAITTDLPTYQTYTPTLATDGDAATFFWSSAEAKVGNYVQLDLGAATQISRITLKMGVAGHEADYIHNGMLEYSTDGKSWNSICAVNSRETVKDVNITARYVRVRVTETQINWVTVAEFSATGDADVPDWLSLDADFVSRTDLLTLLDGHVLSLFAPDDGIAAGHTLRVTVGESGSVRILAVSLPEGGVTVKLSDDDGNPTDTPSLSYDTVIQAPAGSVIEIPLGNGLALAEIIQ